MSRNQDTGPLRIYSNYGTLPCRVMPSTAFINAYCSNIKLARRFSLLVNPIGMLSSGLSTLSPSLFVIAATWIGYIRES